MNRILRIELRRSAAIGTAVILLLVGAAVLYGLPDRWAAGWMPLAMMQREYLILLWPAALAAGGWQARREHRSNVAELFASTARPRAQRMIPTLAAMGIAVAGAYLAMAAAAVPYIIDTANYLSPATFAVVAVGALSLVAAAWLGLAIGRLLPSPVTAPALAVAGLGLLLVIPTAVLHREWLALIFSPMYAMGQYTDYQTVAGRVSSAQVIWLIALAVAAAVLLASGSWRSRVAALLPAVLGAGLAVLIIPHDENVANPVDPVAQELVCASGTPRVCISRIHAGLLPQFVPAAREALARMAKLPGAPTAVHEDTTTYYPATSPAPRPDTLLISVRVDKGGSLAHPQQITTDLVTRAFRGSNDCDKGSEAVSRAAAFWLLGTEPRTEPGVTEDPDPNPEAVKLWQGLRQLPEQQALARVSAVYSATKACKETDGLLTRSAR
ncbi:hypothetical protein AB0J80_03450 [Actinoplanes sp. NPDC049548]|uniref:hypothetical protein n=1 Tax=Actinoplanes sp. NPDC049548 TaxID=3155152 RepID=UPI003437695D